MLLADDRWARAARAARRPARAPRSSALRARPRRPLLTDGRLFIVAADHTARGMLGVRRRPVRHGRPPPARSSACSSSLAHPGVDGVLGSPDVLEELALLGALDGKLAFGTMNRGGIMGARWELDDRMTAYDARRHRRRRPRRRQGPAAHRRRRRRHGIDARGLRPCRVSDCARRGLPIMVEPLPYHLDRGRLGQAARRRRQAAAGRRRGRRPRHDDGLRPG